MSRLLDIENLCIDLMRGGRASPVVHGLSLHVDTGEVLAIVGESGSGKSLSALSILGLLPKQVAHITGGRISFEGTELTRLSASAMNAVRGSRIGMIFQEPMSALNPVMRIGDQIMETLLHKDRMPPGEAHAQAVRALKDVQIAEPELRLRQYPHQLSGGMRQRVMIAMALINQPALLIADEPTTALDVTVQAQILSLLKGVQRARRMSMIIITHDLGIVADIADRVAVMYGGQLIESGPVETVLQSPRHPYTAGLLSCLPEFAPRGRTLNFIPGGIPRVGETIAGCRFRPRCPKTKDDCKFDVPLHWDTGDHAHRCLFPIATIEGVARAC